MNHYFNVELAKQYGIEEAIIIENLYFWIKKNVANEVNKNDGRYWTYNSAKAFAEIFPYMSARKISRVLASLYEKDAILKGNYNELSIDRTMWYSFTDELISVMDLQKYDVAKISDIYDLTKNDTHLPKMSNGKTENDEPIPYSKPYNNQHIKEEKDKSFSKKDDFLSLAAESSLPYGKPKKKSNELDLSIVESEEMLEVVKDWLEYKKERGESYKPRGFSAFYKKLKEYSGGDVSKAKEIVETSMANNWQGIFALKQSNQSNKKDEKEETEHIRGKFKIGNVVYQ